jgi:hypothetical protein
VVAGGGVRHRRLELAGRAGSGGATSTGLEVQRLRGYGGVAEVARSRRAAAGARRTVAAGLWRSRRWFVVAGEFF